MEIRRLELPDVCLIVPRRFEDTRGSFSEIYNHAALEDALQLRRPFVQDNLSVSPKAGTVRALHFQRPPNAQGKLIRVAHGAIRDVAVDVRDGSPSFGQHVMVQLTDKNLELLWVPEGFAHGFVTTAPDTEVTYKTTAYYSPSHEVGIRWNDPVLGIDWGISEDEALVSERDQMLSSFSEIEASF